MTRNDNPRPSGRDVFRAQDSGLADLHELTDDPARQLSLLTAVLDSVSDEARLMDANLNDTHEIASRIGRLVRRRVLGHRGPIPESEYPDIHRQFERSRTDESDVYEVYADDLEQHQKRQRKDRAIAESDADKFAVVKRRRNYIATLFDLSNQISSIIDQLAVR